MRIDGKVALVTGAGSGIGEGIALRLANEGASVVVNDVNETAGDDTVRKIKAAGGHAAFVLADVSSEAGARTMVAFAETTFGGLDILVNNAGCSFAKPYFPAADLQDWTRVLGVYLRGVMLGIHFAVSPMRERGAGVIVNIASGAGLGYAGGGAPEYAAAKAGVVRLTATLAHLQDQVGVRVNCICPGWVDTPASRQTRATMSVEEFTSVPSPMLEPADVADAAVSLIRDDSLAGRVLLYFERGTARLLPNEPNAYV